MMVIESNMATGRQLRPHNEGALLALHSMNKVRRGGTQLDIFSSRFGVPTNIQEHMASANLRNTPYGKKDYIISRFMFRISQVRSVIHTDPHIYHYQTAILSFL